MLNPLSEISKIIQSTRGKCEQYKILGVLGEGAEGVVFKGQRLSDQQIVAIKYIAKISTRELENLERLLALKFTNVINYSDRIQNKESIYIIMQFADKGELYKYYQTLEFKRKSIEERNEIFKQIIRGVEEIHSQNFIHRDLKPENVVLLTVGDKVNISVCDLGLLREKKVDVFMTMNIGTPYYQAPELLYQNFQKYTPYTEKVDIWALGMMWYELLTGTTMLNANNQQELHEKIKSIKDENIAQIIDSRSFEQWIKDLMKKMLYIDEQMRPSAKEIYQVIAKHLSPDKIQQPIQPSNKAVPFQQFQQQNQFVRQGIQQNANLPIKPLISGPQQQPNFSNQQIKQNFQPFNPQGIQQSQSFSQQFQQFQQIPQLQQKNVIEQIQENKNEIKNTAESKINQQIQQLKEGSEDMKIEQQKIKEKIEQQKKEEYEREIQKVQQEADKKLQEAIRQFEEEINKLRVQQELESDRQKNDQQKYQQLRFDQEIELQNKLNLFKAEQKRQTDELLKQKEAELSKNLNQHYAEVLRAKENELKIQLEKEIINRLNAEYNENLRKIREVEELQKEALFNEVKQNVLSQIQLSLTLISNAIDPLKQKQQEQNLQQFQKSEELNIYSQSILERIQYYTEQIEDLKQDQNSLQNITYSQNSENLKLFSEKYKNFVQDFVKTQNESNQQLANQFQKLQIRLTLQQKQKEQEEMSLERQKQELIMQAENLKKEFQQNNQELQEKIYDLQIQLEQLERTSKQFMSYDAQLFQEYEKQKQLISQFNQLQAQYYTQLSLHQDEERTIVTYKLILDSQYLDKSKVLEIQNNFQRIDEIKISLEKKIGEQIQSLIVESVEMIDEILEANDEYTNKAYCVQQSQEAENQIKILQKKLQELQQLKLQLNKNFESKPEDLRTVKQLVSQSQQLKGQIEGIVENIKKIKFLENQIQQFQFQRQKFLENAKEQQHKIQIRIKNFDEQINKILSYKYFEFDQQKLINNYNEVSNLGFTLQAEIQRLEQWGQIKSQEEFYQFQSDLKQMLNRAEQQLIEKEKEVQKLIDFFWQLVEKNQQNSNQAFEKVQQYYEQWKKQIENFKNDFAKFNEFKQYEALSQYDEIKTQYTTSLNELSQKLKDSNKNLEIFEELMQKFKDQITTKVPFTIIQKFKSEMQSAKNLLDKNFTSFREITIYERSSQLTEEIPNLQKQQLCLCKCENDLNQEFNKIVEKKGQSQFQEFKTQSEEFIQKFKNCLNAGDFDDKLKYWQKYEEQLQQNMRNLIQLKKARLLLIFYDLRRYALRIQKKDKLNKNSETSQKYQEDVKLQQEILKFEEKKSLEYEQNKINQDSKHIDLTYLQQIQQDEDQALKYLKDQETFIKTRNLVRLRNIIKNQANVKKVQEKILDLEFNKGLIFQILSA